jgi:hypothetical protein
MPSTKDQGLKRAEGGNTPGILDSLVFGQDDVGSTEGQLLTESLLSLLGIGSNMRFGMSGDEKVRRQGLGFFPGGTPGVSPDIEDADIAQRALSVASASDLFGPEIPLLLSLLSVDNPAVLNPDAAQATRDAFSQLQAGEFVPGPVQSAGTMEGGEPTGPTFGGALAASTASPILSLLSGVGTDARLGLAQDLLNVFGAKEQPAITRRPFEPGPRPLDALGGGVQDLAKFLGDLFGVQDSRAGDEVTKTQTTSVPRG